MQTPEQVKAHRDRLKILWTEEIIRRQEAEARAVRAEAIVAGAMASLTEGDIPLYRRIGNQRRALRQFIHIDYVWSNVMTHEERMVYINRWREAKAEQERSSSSTDGDK